ncbi:hypothetical protein L843_5212 [Mycobacterium intracellulare MIN_061107_1834]|nr:hypothetical protein L843_5212 [Mycobacterium intracellulare MIN_061107_1834]
MRRRGRRLTQARRRDVEQRRPLDDVGDRTGGGPPSQLRPRVDRGVVDLQERRDGGEVVGAGEGERAPAVPRREQAGGAAGDTRPARVRPRRAARPVSSPAASTSMPQRPPIAAATSCARDSTRAREKSAGPSGGPVR